MSTLERVLTLTEQIVGIESVYGDETRIGDWLEQRLRANSTHTLVRAANSLCFATQAPDAGKPTLMLVGHTDTVPRSDENPVRREGESSTAWVRPT